MIHMHHIWEAKPSGEVQNAEQISARQGKWKGTRLSYTGRHRNHTSITEAESLHIKPMQQKTDLRFTSFSVLKGP